MKLFESEENIDPEQFVWDWTPACKISFSLQHPNVRQTNFPKKFAILSDTKFAPEQQKQKKKRITQNF